MLPAEETTVNSTVDPIQHHARPEKAERGHHEHQRAKSSLAHACHALDTNDRCGLSFRRLEQTTTGNAAEGRLSWKKQRSWVDLAPKLKMKI
jgi:hypothetical protein